MSSVDDEATRSRGRAALVSAYEEFSHGSVDLAWQACLIAVRAGRELQDAALVADAATLIHGRQVGLHHLTAARRAACLEALAMLDPSESLQRRQVEQHLAALSDGWTPPTDALPVRRTDDEAKAVILELRAAHAGATDPGRVEDRLTIATRLRDIARTAHRDDDIAWGTLWRMDALAQLGRRLELNADLIELTGVTRRLDSPSWRWRLATIRTVMALLDDHVDDVLPLAAEAARLGAAAGVEESAFLDLVVRSQLALRTGDGLVDIEGDVRRVLAEAPFWAQSWRAGILIALGRVDDAIEIWRALAPHVDDVPVTAMEWLIVTAAHATLAVVAGDQEVAARLYERLLPYASRQVMPTVMTPYGGPVALHLGDLAVFLGRPEVARAHFDAALAGSQDMHAPAYSRQVRAAISRLEAARPTRPPLAPLSPREAEVAGLVSSGLTNREVAHRLFLSERTVENHVSNSLRRLGLANRTALAAWVSRTSPPG